MLALLFGYYYMLPKNCILAFFCTRGGNASEGNNHKPRTAKETFNSRIILDIGLVVLGDALGSVLDVLVL